MGERHLRILFIPFALNNFAQETFSMRGVFSFVLILAFFGVFMSLLSLYFNSSRAIGYSEKNIISLERQHGIELELKDAVKSVLSNPEGENREEMARNAAEKLAVLESFWEKKMSEEGVSADMWAGIADAYEIERLNDEMPILKRTMKCASCFDISEKSLSWKKEAVPRAMAFLDVKEINGRQLEVSRRGVSFVPDVRSSFSSLQGNVVFGASLYFPEENSSMAILLPEGFP